MKNILNENMDIFRKSHVHSAVYFFNSTGVIPQKKDKKKV